MSSLCHSHQVTLIDPRDQAEQAEQAEPVTDELPEARPCSERVSEPLARRPSRTARRKMPSRSWTVLGRAAARR